MHDLAVIDDPSVATVALEPLRGRILESLVEPGSASAVAARLGESRQKVNYHLRALESAGLVSLVEERPRRGLTERVMVASARCYVVAPDVIRSESADPSRFDRLSSQYLIAVGARLVREVAGLAHRAAAADRQLATLAIDTEIRFRSARERAEFTREMGDFVASCAARYHDESAPRGRRHRVVVAAHPRPTAPEEA